MTADNKHDALKSFLMRPETKTEHEEVMRFIETVDSSKLNFTLLVSWLGTGAYMLGRYAKKLLDLMHPDVYDYDTLLYYRKLDHRYHEHIDELIEKIPPGRRVGGGITNFTK